MPHIELEIDDLGLMIEESTPLLHPSILALFPSAPLYLDFLSFFCYNRFLAVP
jgi:hypothetical protein